MFVVAAGSNLKNITPVPPPRRKKRNRGRPLPPKPDEIHENVTDNLRRDEEPLCSLAKSLRTSSDDDPDNNVEMRRTGKEDPKHEGRRTKEIYEHKVNLFIIN